MQYSSPKIISRAVPKGFTLIELIFVMGITVIVFGVATYMISTPNMEREVREAHNGIEDLALRARAMSYSYQQPFVVELREGEVRLMPLARPGDQIAQEVSEQVGEKSALRRLDSMSWPIVFKIDPQYTMSVRRWNSFDFKVVDGSIVERWIHQPNSPCEPLAIELVTDDGLVYLSREFHPLTAKAIDLEMAIGNQ